MGKIDKAVTAASEAVDCLSPTEIVEAGLAVMAKGLYRSREINGPRVAAHDGFAAISVLRDICLDNIRLAALAEQGA